MSIASVATTAAAVCRDRNTWPFAATSIWNTPLGSSAVFVPANLYTAPPSPPARTRCAAGRADPTVRRGCHGWNSSWSSTTCTDAGCCYDPHPSPDPHGYAWCYSAQGPAAAEPGQFYVDTDFYIATATTDPQAPFVNQGWWGLDPKCGRDHCCTAAAPQGKVVGTITFPYNYTTNLSGNNNAAAVLMPDGKTMVQFQPLYRCTPGGKLIYSRSTTTLSSLFERALHMLLPHSPSRSSMLLYHSPSRSSMLLYHSPSLSSPPPPPPHTHTHTGPVFGLDFFFKELWANVSILGDGVNGRPFSCSSPPTDIEASVRGIRPAGWTVRAERLFGRQGRVEYAWVPSGTCPALCTVRVRMPYYSH